METDSGLHSLSDSSPNQTPIFAPLPLLIFTWISHHRDFFANAPVSNLTEIC